MHNFLYTLKVLFHNKMLIFWTFAFPIILGTLFNLAFQDIEKNEKLNIIDIAIVNNSEFINNDFLVNSFLHLSDKNNGEQIFNTIYVDDENDAKKMLQDDEIIGYLYINDEANVIIRNNGIYQTIFNNVVDELLAEEKIVNNISAKNFSESMAEGMVPTEINDFYQKIYADVASELMSDSNATQDISRANLSYTLIEFYTLIAMSCLYGGMLSMVAINYNLPDMGSIGKRISISPKKKGKIIFSSALASYLVILIGLALLFAYTIGILHIDYGSNILLIILLSMVGALAGLSLGIFIAVMIKANDNTKTGILIAITMFGCFLSGMMGVTMKYIVDKNIPIINQLNPAAMITDGFYALYYYDTLDRFYLNIISLLLFAAGLIILSIIHLRRKNYDSI